MARSLVVARVKVTPTARSLVVPATPTSEHWLALSNLDRLANPTFSSAILLYTRLLVRTNRTFSEITTSLKESLAKVLVDFYPLSGRLAIRDDGLVDLHCNNQGAVFLEASLDADLEKVGGARPMSALSGMEAARLGPGPLYIPDQLKPMAVLVIQVTHFTKCGSVAIVVNWHHTVADGSSGCHFMKSWSEVAMGKKLSVKPDHNRDLLRPRTPLDSSLVNEYSTRSLQHCTPRHSAKVSTEPTLLKGFLVSKEVVQRLKAQAKEQDCEYTSVDAISGSLWQLMTKARSDEVIQDAESWDQGASTPQKTRFFMFVEGRKKLGLPAGYFGNVVCSACAMSNEDEILKYPVSYAAGLIRNATRSLTGEYFRSLIDWIEEHGHALSKSEHVNSPGHDVAATFWTYLPLYDVDFGWGKPNFASRNSEPRSLIDGFHMLPSPEGSGNMVALLNLQADRLARLQKDPAFFGAYPATDS